jgi:hypothetical protein
MSAEEAFFACTFLEDNAQIQLQAEIMGGAIALSEDAARDCAEGTLIRGCSRCCGRFTSGKRSWARACTYKFGRSLRRL